MQSGESLMAPFALPPKTKVILAVSGGVDSMSLLTLLAPLIPQITLTVATFDHALRPESAFEQAAVVAFCQQLGVPVQTGRWSTTVAAASEDDAREARFAFLTQVAKREGASFIVTAHHADDQLETILFRLARSGHAASLQGIRPSQSWRGLTILHPLLAVSKATLQTYALTHHVPYATDPTNRDDGLARNRLRHEVVPVLKAVNPQVLPHTHRLTQEMTGLTLLAERQMAALLAQASVSEGLVDWTSLLAEPAVIQRLVLAHWLNTEGCQTSQATQAAILQALQAGHGSHVFMATQATIEVQYRRLLIRENSTLAPASSASQVVTLANWQPFEGGQIGVFKQLPPDALAWARVPLAPLTLRHRRPGDFVQLANGQHKLLRRLLIDQKVPRDLRQSLWVATVGSQVYWVMNAAFAQLFHGPQTDILQAVLAYRRGS